MAEKLSVDLSTFTDAWEQLSDGEHSVTITAKATGYRDSESSNAVSVTKTASGYTVTVGIDDYRFLSTSDAITIYDGQNTSGNVLAVMTKADHSDKSVICMSGHLCLDSAGGKLLHSFQQDGGVAYVSGDGTHTLVYSVTASGSLRYQADM